MAMVHDGHRYNQLSGPEHKMSVPRWDRLAIIAALITFWTLLIYATCVLIA